MYEIPYKNYLNSIFDSPYNRIEIDLWRYNPECQFEINLNRIRTRLCDYINSTHSYGLLPHYCYGLEASQKFLDYLNFSILSGNHLDLRYSRVFMEHSFFIWKCTEQLAKASIIHLSEQDVRNAEKIYKKGECIFLLSIKNNIKNNENIIKNINKEYAEIKGIEIPIIEKIISQL